MLYHAYIALGSNMGNRQAAIIMALDALADDPRIHDLRTSSLHETEPVGGPSGQGKYLNAAASIQTSYSPEALMAYMLTIESRLGRQRDTYWGPRIIDLDLLLFDDRTLKSPSLSIPHPRMHERKFVLSPLAEIAADGRHPVFRNTSRGLLIDLQQAK